MDKITIRGGKISQEHFEDEIYVSFNSMEPALFRIVARSSEWKGSALDIQITRSAQDPVLAPLTGQHPDDSHVSLLLSPTLREQKVDNLRARQSKPQLKRKAT